MLPTLWLCSRGLALTLRRALCGMRRVRKLFGKLLRDPLTKADFKPRSPVPNTYCHEQRDMECVVHGDDVMAGGEGQQLDYMEQVLEAQERGPRRPNARSVKRDAQAPHRVDRSGFQLGWGSQAADEVVRVAAAADRERIERARL